VTGAFGGPRTASAIVYSPFDRIGGKAYLVRRWQLDHFRSYPVVLWGHDARDLVGRALAIEPVRVPRLEGEILAAAIEFAPTPWGREGFDLAQRQLLEFSAGFVPSSDGSALLLEVSAVRARGFLGAAGSRMSSTGVLWCSSQDDGARLREEPWSWAAGVASRHEWDRVTHLAKQLRREREIAAVAAEIAARAATSAAVRLDRGGLVAGVRR